MSEHRREKLTGFIKEKAAEFLQGASNRISMITITRAEIADDLKHGVVSISVFPTSAEKQALLFAKRQEGAFRDFLKKELRGILLPRISFEIDIGEKNRQHVEEILEQVRRKGQK